MNSETFWSMVFEDCPHSFEKVYELKNTNNLKVKVFRSDENGFDSIVVSTVDGFWLDAYKISDHGKNKAIEFAKKLIQKMGWVIA